MNNCQRCKYGCMMMNDNPCQCSCHTPPQEELWVAEFDKRFVVDENSAEQDENGNLKWCDDTKLIADFIDGKTLTAAHIKSFIQKLLEADRSDLLEELDGEVGKTIEDQELQRQGTRYESPKHCSCIGREGMCEECAKYERNRVRWGVQTLLRNKQK